MNYYMDVLKKYATFSGRARRKEYWMFVLINGIIGLCFSVLSFFVPPLAILSMIYSLAVFLPGLAVGVRRLHDIDKSGWWMFIVLIPIVGGLLLLVWQCTDGTMEDNRYGANPKAMEMGSF